MPLRCRIHSMTRHFAALLAAVFLLTGLSAEAADLETAVRALQEGDYETAYREAQPLAEQGDEGAQKVARFAGLMIQLKQEIDQAEEKRLAATGSIDLRDYDGRYRPGRSKADQAQFEKGMSLYNADDYEAAFREWLPLAEAGDAQAQYKLSILYSLGRGVAEDDDKANAYALMSARQGYGPAQGKLASSVDFLGLSEDEAIQREAFYWGIRAAANGEPWGYHTLARAYCYGRGVDRNPVLADTWLFLVYPGKEDFIRWACNRDIELPTPYYEAIAERAKAMRKAYDIRLVPQH